MNIEIMCIRYTDSDPAGTFYFYCLDGKFHTRKELKAAGTAEMQYTSYVDAVAHSLRLAESINILPSQFDIARVPPSSLYLQITSAVEELVNV